MSFKPRKLKGPKEKTGLGTAKVRCTWAKESNPLYVKYHDEEWGRPVHDDRHHFELLTLEGAQAGLSWETILGKREGYRKAFANFTPRAVSKFSSARVEKLLTNPAIVRNRLKVESTITNAAAFIEIQKEFGTFNKYVWDFCGRRIKRTRLKATADYPTNTETSDALSKDLKRRGFRFVGSTIIYAYMQAAGLVDDHMARCFLASR